MLFAAVGLRPGPAFRVGYVGGFAYYLCTLNWLLYIPVKFFPILGWIALSAYLSLYPALWVWICWKFFPKHELQPGAGDRPDLRFLATNLLGGAWRKRTLWALHCGAVWVALEMTLGRFLSGFPWDFLGVSQ